MLMNPSIAGAIAFFVFRSMITSKPDLPDDDKLKEMQELARQNRPYVVPPKEEKAPVILLMRSSAELMFNTTIPHDDKLVLLGRMVTKMAKEDADRNYYFAAVHVAARFERYDEVKQEFIHSFFKEEPDMGEALFNDLYRLYTSDEFLDALVPGRRTELITQVISSHTGLW